MNKIFSFCSVILFAMFAGCDNPSEPVSSQDKITTESSSLSKSETTTANCGCSGVVTLWAGKTINVGTVTVTQDQNNLYVQYKTTGAWKIIETHLDISTSNYSQRGAPGQYDYQSSSSNGVTSYKYTIPITWAPGTKLYFLAHAVVGKYSGSSCGSTETAYGGTVEVPKKGSWYGTFCYEVQATQPTTYTISGYAFVDANSNGLKDGGETGLENVSVTLSNGATASTAANGSYTFTGLNSGSYTVSTGAFAGYNHTSSSTVPVIITTSNGNANFGYAVSTFKISGYTFVDLDGDGTKGTGEGGFGGILVTLSNGATTISDPLTGIYTFSGLSSGSYTVSINPIPVLGYIVTGASSVIVSVATSDATADFGIINPVDRTQELKKVQ